MRDDPPRPPGRGRPNRTRPPSAVVAPRRPWGLVLAAVLVAVFAVAAIGYAVVASQRTEEVTEASDIPGIDVREFAPGVHVSGPVDYPQSPPAGGPHDLEWADCTGTVYDVDIRPENAVHSLEHGAVWITYDPQAVGADGLATLRALTDGQPGTMLSPHPGLTSPVSLQAWGHQLFVDSADDPRVQQFLDLLRLDPDTSPEPGASCEQPVFLADPLVVGDASRTG